MPRREVKETETYLTVQSLPSESALKIKNEIRMTVAERRCRLNNISTLDCLSEEH